MRGSGRVGHGALVRGWGSIGKRENRCSHSPATSLAGIISSPFYSTQSDKMLADKENQGKIAKLEEEAAHYREQLRRRCEEVELLKKEKARLEKSVRDKLAIAAAKKQ